MLHLESGIQIVSKILKYWNHQLVLPLIEIPLRLDRFSRFVVGLVPLIVTCSLADVLLVHALALPADILPKYDSFDFNFDKKL